MPPKKARVNLNTKNRPARIRKCVAPGCNNRNSDGYLLHVVPISEERRKIWSQKLGLTDTLSRHKRLCEAHFALSDYITPPSEPTSSNDLKPKLKPDAEPRRICREIVAKEKYIALFRNEKNDVDQVSPEYRKTIVKDFVNFDNMNKNKRKEKQIDPNLVKKIRKEIEIEDNNPDTEIIEAVNTIKEEVVEEELVVVEPEKEPETEIFTVDDDISELFNRCRLCAKYTDDPIDVFSGAYGLQDNFLNYKIFKHTSIKIEIDDPSRYNLSVKICQICNEKLNDVHAFWAQCKEANKLLNDLAKVRIYKNAVAESKIEELEEETFKIQAKSEDHINYNYTYRPRNKTKLNCTTCEISLSNITSFRNHFKQEHGKLVCVYCDKLFPSQIKLNLHVNEYHKEVCSFCNLKYIDLYKHVQDTHQNLYPINLNIKCEETIDCKECNTTFKGTDMTKLHHFLAHQLYFCEICYKTFNLRDNYDKHLDVIHAIRCSKCKFACYTQDEYKKHWKKDHKIVNPIVPTIFNSNLATKENICIQCIKLYPSKEELKVHMYWAHKACSCDLCNMKFKSKIKEKQHYNSVHKNICYFCDMINIKDDNKHMKCLHKDKIPFICHDCGVKFHTRCELDEHGKTHEIQKHFMCEQCGLRFRFKASLVIHNRLHYNNENKNDYICEYCGKKYNFILLLNDHRYNIHENFKDRISCALCYQTFKHKKNLITHMHCEHSDELKLCVE